MPAPNTLRSSVRPAAARRMRLARRLACGLTPAEVARVEAATEEEILHLLDDADFSGLVREYRAVVELPDDLREARLIGAAWMELEHLMELGDRRAVLFVVYESNRGRHPAKALLRRMKEAFARAAAETEPRAPAVPDPARPPYGPMPGYGWHPLGPAQAAGRHLTDTVAAAAGRDIVREAAAEAPAPEPVAEAPAAPGEPAPAAEAELPALSWSASGEPIAPPGYRVVWVPRHPGVPDLPDELPLSPIAQLAHDFPEFADWFIRRGEQRLAELAREAPEPDRPQRSAGQKPLGP